MNNIKLLFGLVCEDVRLEINGKVSIIGEGNLFFLPNIPMTIPLCIMTKWAGPPGAKGRVTLQMLNPDSGVPVLMGNQEILLGETGIDTAFTGTVYKIGWQVHTAGVHVVQVMLDGAEQGRIELLIKKGRANPKNN